MMIGERNHANHTIHVPPWPAAPEVGGNVGSPSFEDCSFSQTALQRYLPSNLNPSPTDFILEDFDPEEEDKDASGLPMDAYSCDQFRMFEFKVRKCMRGRSHDWTDCPYAHPGEKARRRDPRKYHYSGTACPDFRKGGCKKGDACEFAHGVFECWLHPARYRTQPCKDGLSCRRRICFFAHSPDQLRVLSPRGDGRLAFERHLQFMSSPESGSPPSESPPMSPMTPSGPMSPLSRSLGSNPVNEIIASIRHLQLSKAQAQSTWGLQIAGGSRMAMARPGYCSLPSTPTRVLNRGGMGGYFDLCEEEPVMERVESGRDLRAKLFQKLSKDNPLDQDPSQNYDAPNPDVGWVAELIN